jgi:hypothetical protein
MNCKRRNKSCHAPSGAFAFRQRSFPKMSTAAQLEANRENAQHSTGPITEEGKARSSQNRFKHGFCSRFEVLESEDQDAFNRLCLSLRTEHNPSTPTENILVDRMAQHYWLSQRAQLMQDMAFAAADRPLEHAQKAFALYLRYQTTNDRAFSKCLNDLLKLRAERRKQEIGFEREKQREAELARKQEAHEARTRLTNARAAEQELDNDIKAVIEARLPGHTAIPFSALKDVLSNAISNLAAELDADPKLTKMSEAA